MKKQKNLIPPTGEFIFYQTEDGRTRIQCRFADDRMATCKDYLQARKEGGRA
jgi:uncharacterized cysteine cluster protein YcgN (CxxCxxCC family)